MLLNNSLYQKILLYFLFWIVSFYIGLEVFSYEDEYRTIDVIYTFLFHIPLIFGVSLHSYHLIPNYLAKSRFWIYAITLVIGVYGASIPLYFFTFNVFSEWLFPNYYLVGVFSRMEFAGILTLYLILSSFLEFSQRWLSSLKSEKHIAELESEKKASELRALRAQVNPHFLFNSLNTIYSEALDNSDKAPKLILQLSDMLRYAVDNLHHELVLIEDEIEYLKNYIDLHRERLNDPSKINFNITGETGQQKIAPMLLINFIENSFKHADLTEEDSFISIQINIQEQTLSMICKNTFFVNHTNKKERGAGLQNAQKRLSLSYPDRHQLKIITTGNVYHLKLTLELG